MKNYENDVAISYIDRDWPDIESEITKHVIDWSVCIQAGGHFGLYPKRLSKMFSLVYTFEADSSNYEKLIETCGEENNIICHLNALSSYSRFMDVLHLEGGNTGQNIVVPGSQVKAISIDSLKLTSCGLIQLDIERHELFAIMGALETIEKFKPVIILEGPETTNNSCNIILEQLGYELVGRAGVDSVFKYTARLGPTTEYSPVVKKKILIAIPTARYIESDTFKSIYDLEIPEGYEATFQTFYGYRVDQVRNLIADWVVRGFDYLFAVDHDVTFAPDTLKKMLSHDVDLVSGIYRQRLEPQMIEIYNLQQQRMDISQVYGKNLVQIGGCGFGCVLVKQQVFTSIGYPQFEYHVALNHANTISEDTDFCRKAMNKGFTLWCDPSILCGHIGSTTMTVALPQIDPIQQRLQELHDMPLLPADHVNYLKRMNANNIEPKVIYDIGACVLHWTNRAKEVWPNAQIIPFEAMKEVEFLYKNAKFTDYAVGCVLSDKTGDEVEFYQNLENPGGNSLYKENPELSPLAPQLFPENKKVKYKTNTLDDIVKLNNLPLPDLIKMDIQGSELAALKGATETLKNCNTLILELQHKDYNFGAPKSDEVIQYLKTIGFDMVGHGSFCGSEVDGDYHFVNTLLKLTTINIAINKIGL